MEEGEQSKGTESFSKLILFSLVPEKGGWISVLDRIPRENGDQGAWQSHLLPPSLQAVKLGRLGKRQ